MRLAFASFGINTPVLSVVISVFMAGLALGSLLGGALVSRRSSRSPSFSIFLYGASEGLIGIGAFAVPALFSWGARVLLPFGNADSGRYLFFSAVAVLLSLLPWCICMGATFPFMMDFIRKTSKAKDSFSFLYTANVFGAMAGVAATAVALIEWLGFHRTLAVGAFSNFSICAVSFAVGAVLFPSRTPGPGGRRPPLSAAPPSPPSNVPASLAILFSTGFVSMAMEVIWTRDFTFVLKTQVYSFASLLFFYLLSTFCGSWIYRATRRLHVVSTPLLILFTFCFSLFPLILDDPRIQASVAGVLLSIVPFCLVLGYLTPMLVDRFSGGDPGLAARAYAVNVLGCILGPLAASYLLLPHFGVKFSILLLAALFLPFFREQKPLSALGTPLGKVPTLALLALILFTAGTSRDFENVPESFYKHHVLYRDYAATVIAGGEGLKKRLYVNGIAMTDLDPTTKVMAHLPLALLSHPPRSALDICFGMGTTYRSLLSWNIRATAVELAPSVFKCFGFFFNDAARLEGLPNGCLVVDDGRRFLERSSQSFDVITIDPPPPIEAAGSSLLYSSEFLHIVKQHLTPGGILQLWMPVTSRVTTQAISRTVSECFPHVRVFPSVEYVPLVSRVQMLGYFFIASSSPIPHLSPRELAGKMPASARKDLLEWFPPGMNCTRFFTRLLSMEVPSHAIVNPSFTNTITDDRPFNEYYLLRRLHFLNPGGAG